MVVGCQSLSPPTPNVDISPSRHNSLRPLLTPDLSTRHHRGPRLGLTRPAALAAHQPRPGIQSEAGQGKSAVGRRHSKSEDVWFKSGSKYKVITDMGMVEIPVQRLSEEEQAILRQEAEIERMRQRR